jgi:hypothetical protein
MTTLRVITSGPKPKRGLHGYTCSCEPCIAERWKLTPGVCQCERPVLYTDGDGDHRCTCGRAARPTALRPAA